MRKIVVTRPSMRWISINCEKCVVRRSDNDKEIIIECAKPDDKDVVYTTINRGLSETGKRYVYRGLRVFLTPGVYVMIRDEDRVILRKVMG